MSDQQFPQAVETSDVAAPRQADAAQRRFQVGDPIPGLCGVKDLAYIFEVSINTIYDWKNAGRLRAFELSRPFGSKYWSGKRVQEFVNGPEAMTLLKRRA